MKNKSIAVLFFSMIALGAICGTVFYFLFMSTGGLLIIHCISVGIFFGVLNALTAILFIKKYTTVKSDNERLGQQIRVDKLTQLSNRYAFDEDIKHIDPGTACSMIFIDIDNFRGFNNNYGHHAGDKVLIRCADIIKDNISSSDRVYRYGGEEIVIILDGRHKIEAEEIGQNILQKIRNLDNSPYSNITISAGIASIPDDAKTIEQLVKLSDSALIKAKKQGKNRIVNYSAERSIN